MRGLELKDTYPRKMQLLHSTPCCIVKHTQKGKAQAGRNSRDHGIAIELGDITIISKVCKCVPSHLRD